MIVDTSALIAILREEPGAKSYAEALVNSGPAKLPAATYVELVNVLDRRVGVEAVEAADELIQRAGIEIVAFDPEQAKWARHARLTYGTGRSAARLNFGDCFVYALAKATGEPLLFKGNDFSHTDITPAV